MDFLDKLSRDDLACMAKHTGVELTKAKNSMMITEIEDKIKKRPRGDTQTNVPMIVIEQRQEKQWTDDLIKNIANRHGTTYKRMDNDPDDNDPNDDDDDGDDDDNDNNEEEEEEEEE